MTNKNCPFGTQPEYAVAHSLENVEGLGKICAGKIFKHDQSGSL